MTLHIKKPRPERNRDTAHEKINEGILAPVDRLLEQLSGVKRLRPDRWQARCPAHDDRSPSLSITEIADGTLLIRCWAGCSADAIVDAVGLELKDLFPPRLNGQDYRAGKPPRYSPAEIVMTAITEATILMLGYRSAQRGETLSLRDQGRIEVAVQTLQHCREVVSCR